MKTYSVLVVSEDGNCVYHHRHRISKEQAEQIAAKINSAYGPESEPKALVVTDAEGENMLRNAHKKMNKYAIITPDGFCESPNGNDVSNCQYLGRIAAESKEQAIEKFWAEEEWVTEKGYDITEAIAIQLHETEWV